MKWLALPILALFMALMIYAESDLPSRGDAKAPASVHVSPVYLERSLEDTKTPNVVTAVLADYRSHDTFGETVVIFTAGLASILILTKASSDERSV